MSLHEVQYDTDRDRLLGHFAERFKWIPHWGAEVTMAVEGLDVPIEDAYAHAGSRAVLSTLRGVDKYRVEAETEVRALRIPIIAKNALIPVRHEAIHEDPLVMGAMARHLLFRHSLKKDKWPFHPEPQFSKKLKPYNKRVTNLSRSRRVELWQLARSSEVKRGEYWLDARMAVNGNPKVMNAIALQRQLQREQEETRRQEPEQLSIEGIA